MRFKRNVELEHGLRQIDITPLIDMVFQLLIFFMLTSSFIMYSGIKVNLPKAVTAEPAREENLVIAISRENVLYLDKKVITNRELKGIFSRAKKDNIPVSILNLSWLWPFPKDQVKKVIESSRNVVVIEGNYLGQLAGLIAQETGVMIKERYHRFDGRPFYPEEIVTFVKNFKA